MKILLASVIALSSVTPVLVLLNMLLRWETTSQTCWKSVYREKYVSGTRENPNLCDIMGRGY